jgi:hypothetical protein
MDRAVGILDKAATLDEKARRLAIDEAASRPRRNPVLDAITAAARGEEPSQ